MTCPACKGTLTSLKAADVQIDVCKGGCGGMWFDRFELSKFDEPSETEGEALLHVERNPTTKVDPKMRKSCPKCNVVMMQHFFSVKKQVSVDECPKCAGFWLDVGELSGIRNEYSSEGERKKAAEAYFEDLFGKDLAKLRETRKKDASKAESIANMFRLICPSYYLPGKQSGGAF